MLVTVTDSMQAGFTLMSLETDLMLVVLKRYKKLNSISPKPGKMSPIFS